MLTISFNSLAENMRTVYGFTVFILSLCVAGGWPTCATQDCSGFVSSLLVSVANFLPSFDNFEDAFNDIFRFNLSLKESG